MRVVLILIKSVSLNIILIPDILATFIIGVIALLITGFNNNIN